MTHSVKYLIGDTREQIATIADSSVSLVACSPPFIALRSYLPADHPDKNKEIGSEPDPATFLDTLLQLTAEWGRVLAPWGSIAIELGDTYAGSGGAGGDYNADGLRDGQDKFDGSSRKGGQWPRPKCLALVPQLYAASLAYGRNLLTGEDSPAGQWLVRNMIVWHRPNPAVGALGDKFRPSTSYITVATRSPKRWFDLTAVRQVNDPARLGRMDATGHEDARKSVGLSSGNGFTGQNPAGAPPLDAWFYHHDAAQSGALAAVLTRWRQARDEGGDGDAVRVCADIFDALGVDPHALDTWTDHHDTWTITTQPSSLAHYAMWPAKLAERLVLSMCPLEVCGACGEPRRRVEGKAEYVNSRTGGEVTTLHFRSGEHIAGAGNNVDSAGQGDRAATRVAPTLGWTDCGHDAYAPGTVLDPFAGSGTTCLVAEYHGRNAIGIDIDERNRDMVPLRREEVRRALNPTYVKPITGQLDMFGDPA